MNSESLNVDINVLCQIIPEKTDAFAALLRELISVVGVDNIITLKQILIVDDSQVVNVVNSIIKTVEPSAVYMPRDTDFANALSLPVERDGLLSCFIVMSDVFLKPLTLEHNHPFNTVSTLLEELLHVGVYTSAWQRRGYVQHRSSKLNACEMDVLTIATQMCDEYVVIRRKSQLLATYPLFEPEPGKGFSRGKLSYDGDLIKKIGISGIELKKAVIEAAGGSKVISEVRSDVMRILYRGIFEPLSRNAAYCDETNEDSAVEQNLQAIKFYRELIADYWCNIHKELTLVFESNLSETEPALKEICGYIRELLKRVGITYGNTQDGQYWVNFGPNLLDAIE